MTYTPEQEAYIKVLKDTIEGFKIPMAVVDYKGKMIQTFDPTVKANSMGMVEVTDDNVIPSERFGVRDLRHVNIYSLTVVSFNPVAQKQVDKDLGDDPMGDHHGRNE